METTNLFSLKVQQLVQKNLLSFILCTPGLGTVRLAYSECLSLQDFIFVINRISSIQKKKSSFPFQLARDRMKSPLPFFQSVIRQGKLICRAHFKHNSNSFTYTVTIKLCFKAFDPSQHCLKFHTLSDACKLNREY